MLIFLNPKYSKYYQNETWAGTSVLYENENDIKMTVQQDLAIFNRWHFPFSIVSHSPF